VSKDNPQIAILGFAIECNRFAPVTTAADFEQDVDIRGNQIVSEARSGASITMPDLPGFFTEMDRTGQWTPVPLRVSLAQPGGPVEESFFRTFLSDIEAGLKAAGPLDAVFISAHGAALAEGTDDPDGDLFEVIRDGRASVATDRVKTFTERAVVLESGTELGADIVVTATGLQLLAFGGAELTVDGAPVRLPETMAYKGMMLSGVPNFAFTIGYTNASWTLKADLVSEFACRLLKYMDAHGYDTCVPVNDDPAVTPQPLLDFQAGYVLRSIDDFPRAGSRAPWRLGQSYAHDVVTLRHGKIDDGSMRFARAVTPSTKDLADVSRSVIDPDPRPWASSQSANALSVGRFSWDAFSIVLRV